MVGDEKEVFLTCPNCNSTISKWRWEQLVYISSYNREWKNRIEVIGLTNKFERDLELYKCPLCEDGYVAIQVVED